MHLVSCLLRDSLSLSLLLSLLLWATTLTTVQVQALTLSIVEGHSVHRIASRFRTTLVGKTFTASSPNGRFAAGSSAIDQCVLSRMEAVGKNLFAFFGSSATDQHPVVVHVHFGMSGAWSIFDHTEEPEVKPTTRLRLEEIVPSSSSSSSSSSPSRLVAHLSAMTVQHGDMTLYTTKKASLGQDPLRPDADPDFLYEKVRNSKKSIGALIMDQSFFSGPGNIYRAEILLLAGIYPTTPGSALDRAAFDRVWDVSVKLLRRGYDTGSILTVDADSDPELAQRGERRYIYNKSLCARCSGPVRSWDMGGRTCYACEGGCQPKIVGGSTNVASGAIPSSSTPKKAAKTKQEQHVPFISHCAPDGYKERLAKHGAEGLTIKEIRSVIEDVAGANALPPTSARKAVHVHALTSVLAKNGVKEEEGSNESLPPPIISAEDAAREKAVAGENRAVEHVAELSREQAIEAVAVVTPSPISRAKKSRASKKRTASKAGNKSSPRTRTARSRRRLHYD